MSLKKIIGAIYKADTDYNLIQNGDRICVGVSGGKDSILLFIIFNIDIPSAIFSKSFKEKSSIMVLSIKNIFFTNPTPSFQFVPLNPL